MEGIFKEALYEKPSLTPTLSPRRGSAVCVFYGTIFHAAHVAMAGNAEIDFM